MGAWAPLAPWLVALAATLVLIGLGALGLAVSR